jgi:hypothetical protein
VLFTVVANLPTVWLTPAENLPWVSITQAVPMKKYTVSVIDTHDNKFQFATSVVDSDGAP